MVRKFLWLVFLIFAFVVVRRWWRSLFGPADRRGSPAEQSAREERHYADVLGLGRRVSPTELRRRYRQLIAQYHPDKVQHLGGEIQKLAEQKTKEINRAYEYFRRKCGGE